jgi:hypothetical protein
MNWAEKFQGLGRLRGFGLEKGSPREKEKGRKIKNLFLKKKKKRTIKNLRISQTEKKFVRYQFSIATGTAIT